MRTACAKAECDGLDRIGESPQRWLFDERKLANTRKGPGSMVRRRHPPWRGVTLCEISGPAEALDFDTHDADRDFCGLARSLGLDDSVGRIQAGSYRATPHRALYLWQMASS